MAEDHSAVINGDVVNHITGGHGVSIGFMSSKHGVKVIHRNAEDSSSPSPSPKSPWLPRYYDRPPSYHTPEELVPSRKNSSAEPISNPLALFVAKRIGKSWKHLGIALGLDDYEIDNIRKDNEKEGVVEMAYQTIRKWREKNFRYATRYALEDALLTIDRTDILEKMPRSPRPTQREFLFDDSL